VKYLRDPGAQAVWLVEGNTASAIVASSCAALARSKTPCVYGSTLRENREIPCSPVGGSFPAGRGGKSKDVIRR
jgi:hypothetical protein